jgi:hypothetical protein
MKLGYKVTGNGLYVPLFNNGQGWIEFKSKYIHGDMRHLCQAFGNLSAPRRWSEGQWLLDPFDKKIPEDEWIVFFTKPLYLHAFLGAAKYWWEQQKTVEVNIEVESHN